MESDPSTDYHSVWKECISRDDALRLYLSMELFTDNTDKNKELYKSMNGNKKTAMPTQIVRSFSEDWYDSMCLLYYWLTQLSKDAQKQMKEALKSECKPSKFYRKVASHLEAEATKLDAISSVHGGQDIANSIIAPENSNHDNAVPLDKRANYATYATFTFNRRDRTKDSIQNVPCSLSEE